MAVAQRGTSATGLTNGTGVVRVCPDWVLSVIVIALLWSVNAGL